jgi:hypothetical protein
MGPAMLDKLPPPVHEAYLHPFTTGIDAVFAWAIPVAVLTFLVTWLIKEVPLRGVTVASE